MIVVYVMSLLCLVWCREILELMVLRVILVCGALPEIL